MASVVSRPKGHKWIQFTFESKRRTLRLGKCSKKSALHFKTKIESILECRNLSHPLNGSLCEWLKGITDETHSKIAATGIIEPRVETTLAKFLETYLAGRTDIKAITVGKYKVVVNKLVSHFGAGRRIDAISEGDAEDFAKFVSCGEAVKSENTVRKAVQICKTIFGYALRKELVQKNPFSHIASNTIPKSDRSFFVTQEMANKVLATCPSIEWQLLFALARYGGMRTPSEPRELKWCDIDWQEKLITVTSPKTERHHNGTREMPLFPKLSTYLKKAKQAAPEDAVYVLPRLRDKAYNPSTHMRRIVAKACGSCWDKVFQNCRSTRQTELDRKFPAHVVVSWMGNSIKVANDFYLQVTNEDFEQALAESIDCKQETEAKQNPKQQVAAEGCEKVQLKQKEPQNAAFRSAQHLLALDKVPARGLEPPLPKGT